MKGLSVPASPLPKAAPTPQAHKEEQGNPPCGKEETMMGLTATTEVEGEEGEDGQTFGGS